MKEVLKMQNIFSKYFLAQSKNMNVMSLPESILAYQEKSYLAFISLKSTEIFDLNGLFF